MKKIGQCLLTLFLVFAILSAPLGFADEGVGNLCDKLVLKNGAVILHNYIPDSPLVTIEMRVKSGLSNEGEYAGSGVSHFLEHLLFKGTSDKSSLEIRREIKRMGGVINGATGHDSAEYYITVPAYNLDKAVSLLVDMVMSPIFTDKEFETERDVILKEIRLHNDDPLSKRTQALFALAYDKHAYKYPVIGVESRFLALTKGDILKYHNNTYTPDRMVLGIAGGIKREDAFKVAFRALNRYQKGRAEEPAIVEEPASSTEKNKKITEDVTLGYLAIGFHTVSLYSDDLYAGDALGILLGNGNDSRLYKRLVKEKQLLYTLSCENYTPRYPGLFIITGVGSPEKIDEARDEIFASINELLMGDIEEGEIERAKKNVISDYLHSHETNSSIASTLTTSQLLTGSPHFYDKYVKRMQNVTKEDIKRVLAKYLTKNNSSTVVLVPEESVRAYPRVRPKTTEGGHLPDRQVGMDPPLHELERNTRVPSDEPRSPNPDPRLSAVALSKAEGTILTLDNGLKIVAKKRPWLGLVSVTFAAEGGLRAERKEESGISNLTAATVLKGTNTRSEGKIVPEIEKNGGSLDAFSGFNSIGVTMDILSEDIENGMKIFEDVLKNSVFPADEVQKQKKKITAAIQEEDHDLFDNGLLHLRRLLFGNHPYGRRVAGEVKIVEAIPDTALRDFYAKRFYPAGSVLSIAGDFSRKDLENIIEWFSHWKKEAVSLAAEKAPQVTLPQEEHISMRKEEAAVFVGYPAVGVQDERKYALEVISSILSGSDGLLFDALREKEGIAYSSAAVVVPEIETGFFAVYAATTDENIEKVREIIPAMIHKIKRGEISDDDIESSKNRLVTAHSLSLETNSSISMAMALDELYGLGANNYVEYPKKIKAVTREDIVRAARETFDDKKAVSVIIHPIRFSDQ